MPKVTFVIGLPASGKSTCLDEHIRDGVPVFDDFMKGSPPDFAQCKHLPLIQRHLNDGRDIVMADVCLVRQAFRDEVLAGLEPMTFDVEYCCFANAPEQCMSNSARRVTQQAKDHESEMHLISNLSRDYTYPAEAQIIEVVEVE
jgi:hypothetical protein